MAFTTQHISAHNTFLQFILWLECGQKALGKGGNCLVHIPHVPQSIIFDFVRKILICFVWEAKLTPEM